MPKNKEIIPATKPWKYEDSVEAVKPLVALYNKVSLDLVRELYAAREALSNSGFRTDLTSAQMSQGSYTWSGYCSEIGIPYATAKRWLALYSPQEDKLYTPEEMDQKLEELFQKIRKMRLKEYGWSPDGWTEAMERKYKKWLSLQTTQESIQQDTGFSQAELFSREYFNLLARQMQDAPTPAEIIRFNDLCDAYSGKVTNVVKIEDQITIVQVVEKALSLFSADKRPEVARSIASIIQDLSMHMEEGK